MSAIGGIINTSDMPVEPLLLQTMSDAIKSRGGDAEDQWSDNHAGLFCKQLWTTPESIKETLPLHDPVNGLTLTADARIDNRHELIEQLCTVQDAAEITDSELILQSYQKWGEACVEHLIGDFAFAIWDEKAQRLFSARDHLGIKPFFYCVYKGCFVFASQIEAVHVGAKLQKKPDMDVVKQFYEYRMLSCGSTMFEKVVRLLPAHTLIFQNGKLKTRRYWFPEEIQLNKNISLKDATEGFLTVMNRAIADRMRSAYPVGCEVSGGLDSSTVLALAKDVPKKQDLLAFANTYGDLLCDESSYIKDVVDKLKVKTVYTRADKIDYKKYNLKYFHALSKDWPGKGVFLDAFGEFEAAKVRGVRVVLTGHGGDAVTAGSYDMLTDYLATGHFLRLFRFFRVHGPGKSLIKNFLIRPFLSRRSLAFLYRMMGKNYKHDQKTPYIYCLNKSAGFHSSVQQKELEILLCPSTLLWFDSNPYTLFGEHYGIEARHPFFDKRVVEFMLALPSWYKFDGINQKIIIRESMRTKLPASVLKRNDKAEFTPILLQQMRQGLKKGLKIQISRDIMEASSFAILQEKLQGLNVTHAESNDLWKAYCLEEWSLANFKEL